ncbi:hypothetical protein COO91_09614 (plasmid) [Nostoc flagelliforme CCNUN1]|uniref:Uncharacterized protein n=1 Tax=Nostoc flagelliforme CCNUN1 TaxID=2038116 RepID=A0A2K8T8N0_9NOSO|nr:hypothetical protein COO91_09614 [Nostoc flagelliforme CCNUN1]
MGVSILVCWSKKSRMTAARIERLNLNPRHFHGKSVSDCA